MKAYVAYGSNLDLHQMYRRCPTSELWRTGYIEGYELNFKKMPMGRAAFATIDKKKGARVPVGVFRINRFDEKMLDLYEGYPRHYRKKMVSVALDGGGSIEAMVYIMNPSAKPGTPSRSYLDTIVRGYEDCGLDYEALDEALARCPQE